MKNILLATTALVMTAGVAAAEVAVTGSARMGVLYDGDNSNFTNRIRVVFGMSGETDGGLSFGASVRADQAVGANGSNSTDTAGSIFISGAFGRLSMGDVAGAAEAAVGDLSGVGLTGLGDFSDTVFITGDGVEIGPRNPIIQYSYTAGGFSVYLSANDGRISGGSLGTDGGDDVNNYSLGVAYAFGDYTVGLGYEDADDGTAVDSITNASHIVLGGSAKFGETTVKAVYGQADDIDFTQYGISVDSTFGATTVTGFAKRIELGAGETTALGIGASYDLGGGAAVKGGIVNVDDGVADDTIADLGVTFDF